MKNQMSEAPSSVENTYRLGSRVPVNRAVPFDLQRVLAMFVSNIAPIIFISGVAEYNGAAFTEVDKGCLIQAAMIIAGIETLLQLYPVLHIGSRLPVVMGVSLTFPASMQTIAKADYGRMIDAVIVGDCIEGLLDSPQNTGDVSSSRSYQHAS